MIFPLIILNASPTTSAVAVISIVGVPDDEGAPLLEPPALLPLLAPVPLDDGDVLPAPVLPEDWPEEAAPPAPGTPRPLVDRAGWVQFRNTVLVRARLVRVARRVVLRSPRAGSRLRYVHRLDFPTGSVRAVSAGRANEDALSRRC